MSGIVFINYRREDAYPAGWLFDRLAQEFSRDQLFFDIDNIPPGKDFVAYLNTQVEACDVLLALIGPNWQSQLDRQEYGEAGTQTKDFVRVEIEAALSQGKTIIPVLISGAEMPREEDLPETLQPFARRNAVRLSREHFKADAAGITNALKAALAEAAELRTIAAEEAARLRAEEERRAKAEREAKEQAEKDAARREAAVAGLSREEIAKAEELANWNFIADRDDPQKFRDHLARFPKGVCSRMAAEKLERLLWLDLGEAPNIEALSSFLEEFPEGAHAGVAQARLHELRKAEAEERAAKEREQNELAAWNVVKDTTDPDTLEAFLRDWPDSPHKAEALRLDRALAGGTRRKVLFGTAVIAIAAALITGVAMIGLDRVFIPLRDSSLHTFKGHEGSVFSVVFSPDGLKVLSGGCEDGTLKLWDVATGGLLTTLSGHSDCIQSVAFAPDGHTALSGSSDTTLKLWNLATGNVKWTFKGHSARVFAVAFAPDGRTVLSGSEDDSLKLWNKTTGTEICSFKGHSAGVSSVAFAPDGLKVLSGSYDNTLRLWDANTCKEIHIFSGHSGSVFSVAFSPDGRTALSGSSDTTLKLWDVATGKELRTFKGHSARVFAVAFAPDGRTVLSGSEDKILKLWDVATGEEIRTLHGHLNTVRSIAFAPKGNTKENTALSGSWDRTVKLWNVDR